MSILQSPLHFYFLTTALFVTVFLGLTSVASETVSATVFGSRGFTFAVFFSVFTAVSSTFEFFSFF